MQRPFGYLFDDTSRPAFDSPVVRLFELGFRAAGWATVAAALVVGFLAGYLVAL